MPDSSTLDLSSYGITAPQILRCASPAVLYEHGVRDGDRITACGALAAWSGEKTGRSPKDKRIVQNSASENDIWWGRVNIPLTESAFQANRRRAFEAFNACPRLYVVDGFAGADPRYRVKVRVLCARPYHALFMHNMLIRPTVDELDFFGEPDFVVINAGQFSADPSVKGNSSTTSVAINFERREMVILGTQYAGEMKKGVFTLMHYEMPRRGVLSLHCAANEGADADVSLFFGLSGTGKTTLSADPRRRLVGDDEHCWSDEGVFNIEGGCYAKCIGLSRQKEPEIFEAIRFGALLENVVVDPATRLPDFADGSISENTRVSYPIEFIERAKIPGMAGHPRNLLLLTCDAFGVLPPVARLTKVQAMYHFVSGYSAKVAGTEMGVVEPEATFSACYGAAFLAWHPTRYAEMLSEELEAHSARAWLINTGWSGGGPGKGSRIPLACTRAILDAIHSGRLDDCEVSVDPIFGLAVPRSVPGVPDRILTPEAAWSDRAAFEEASLRLARQFAENFSQFAGEASAATLAAGPRLPSAALA